jgi:hypothetical protein
MLYSTPYLYSSRTLQDMYGSARKATDITAIQEHMLRHEVYLDRQYRGYYYLSEKIEGDLYGTEHPVSWNELLEDYQLFKDAQGNLSIQPRKDGDNMTIVGELGVVYGVTGATVMSIKLLKRKGLHLPDWVLRAGLKCLLIGTVWYVLRDMLDVFLR